MADTKISALTDGGAMLATDELVIARAGASLKVAGSNLLGGLFDAYAMYQDQKAANTAGGSSVTGSWLQRVLNTEVFDSAGIGTLASNRVTLAAGTYWLDGWTSFGGQGNVGPRVKARIRDITNSATLAISGQGVPGAASGVVDDSVILQFSGRATFAGSTDIEVQYQTQQAVATNGLGWAVNYGEVEVYTQLVVWRES